MATKRHNEESSSSIAEKFHPRQMELYREAYAQLQDWSDAAEREGLMNAAELSPAQRWRRFQALVAFCRRIQPQPSPYERAEKLASLERFSHAVRELERWKRDHDRSA